MLLAIHPGHLHRAAPCPIFPASNPWNRPVDRLPVAANSAQLIASIGADSPLQAEFGTGADGAFPGIPFNVVGPKQRKTRVTMRYASESDPGPYPIPADPKIEPGTDRHLLLLDRAACRLYELYAAQEESGTWTAGSGAIWNLRTNALRPQGRTSADAAGLPIFPGLVRYDEVAGGVVRHAFRFTAPRTRRAYIYPARHFASDSNDPALPPMGLRVRLKASFDVGGFPPQARVILVALKRYGMILADNGSAWGLSGAPSAHWDDAQLGTLDRLTGADFEVVDTSSLRP